MSKKSKRMRAIQQVSNKPAETAAEKSLRQANTEIKPAPSPAHKMTAAIQETQYKYIVPELLRITIIGAIFFVAIILLSFIVK
jgi:hypothetical protein